MIESRNFKNVFWAPQGTYIEPYFKSNNTLDEGWYFWDVVGLLGGGPYPTEKEAAAKLDLYAAELEKI